MWASLNENPTREKIIFMLKKNGALSIDSISRELSITSMGIRQHLLSLERKGLIEYVTKRQGIGRPAFLYRLTEKAEDLFPKTYDSFVLNVLRDIEKREGKEKIGEIFKWHRNRLLKEAREALQDKKTLHDRILALDGWLQSAGYVTEVQSGNGHFRLRVFNCPIYKIALDYREACHYDLLLLKDILGKEVTREECISEGSPACVYAIPRHTS